MCLSAPLKTTLWNFLSHGQCSQVRSCSDGKEIDQKFLMHVQSCSFVYTLPIAFSKFPLLSSSSWLLILPTICLVPCNLRWENVDFHIAIPTLTSPIVEALFLLYLQEKFGAFFSYNLHLAIRVPHVWRKITWLIWNPNVFKMAAKIEFSKNYKKISFADISEISPKRDITCH